ncbi:choice-of-anchor L domain-containing protein, partial [Flavobacterium akiainvivens]
MKKLLLVAAFIASAAAFSQGISVNPNAYTTNQLVNTVLVKNSCLAQVSNVSKSTGTDFGYTSGNGIGYFTNTNPNFPMSSGVVLTSGNAVAAQGPNTNVSSFTAAAWGGDAALNTVMAAAGLPMNSKNATSLEFDFVAATTQLSINYLFASEEYGTYQCESRDAVAILLTNVATGVTTNIAVTPATNQPVSVATIRNILNNSNCTSQNPTLFGQFNGGGNAAASAINYEGQTVLMNASAVLTVGAAYHIKVVVADDGGTAGTDGDYDSAVFFPEGSFDLGQEVVGPSLTQAAGTALCTGETYTINTELNPALYGLSWTRNGDPVAGGATIDITQTGDYILTISNPATGCTTTQPVTVEFAPDIVPNQPGNLYACDNGGTTFTYNLVQNTPVIIQGLNPATLVTYHTTADAANNNTGALSATYTGTPGQTIYARVKSHNSSCYEVVSFQLLTMAPPTATQPGNLSLCETTQGSGTAVFNLSQQSPAILGSQPASQNTIAYFTSQANANNNVDPITTAGAYTGGSQTIYVRVSRNFDVNCFATTSFNLVVTPIPVIPDPEDITACDSYLLPALTTGGYFSSPNGVGPIAQGSSITSSQTVYIYAQTATTPACTAQTSFFVNVVTGTTIPEDVEACSSYTLPTLPSGQFYYNGPDGTGGQIAGGTAITATQDIYFYVPAAATCTGNATFTVTIIQPPVIDDPADVNVCEPYTLPALTNGGYFSSPNGVGPIAANTVISTNQTIYVYAASPADPACTSQNSFTVTINNITVTPSDDITRCGSYQLPALTGGAAYYSSPNGVGPITNTNLTTSQTVYIYAASPTNPACFAQDSFVVTINPLPGLDAIPNVTECTGYILPNLPAGVNYYNGSNPATATVIPQGTNITATQTIYAITPPNEFGCRRVRQFVVTIVGNTPPANPGNQNVCGSYTLPALTSGAYWTGPNGTGTQRFAGDVITTTQTLYVYVVSNNTTPPCSAQSSFVVTVTAGPNIPNIPNVVACNSYTLPALAVGNYYTQPNGGGTMLPANTVITTNQTIYAWAQTGGTQNCTTQRTFTVTIINGSVVPANVTECTSYTLPALTVGGYYSSPNGVGPIAAGTAITATQTIYVYVPVTSGTNCTANNNFTVTITNQPVIPDPEDVSACASYTLPALSSGQYWTGPNGTGTQLFAGNVITSSQIVYVYAANPTVPNCTSQNTFNITINNIDVADVPDQLVCGEYILPPLAVGGYFSSANGVGPIAVGTPIDTNQTIYIYAQTDTTPACSDQETFTVTIKPSPVVPDPGYVAVCGSYILPELTTGNYYTGPGGTGTLYPAGTEITVSQDIYIYAETGGVPNCSTETIFSVVINPEPPANVSACDGYELPELLFGNYYSAPAGGGTPFFAGDIITETQDVYVYVESTVEPNCTDNNFFTITINPTPIVAAVDDVEICDVYVLPQLATGNYYTGPGGTGTLLLAGAEITTTQTIYVFAQTATVPNCTDEESFLVTIHVTPVTDARSDVEICDEYVLDPLTVGNYFELPGGPDVPGQVSHAAGEVITEDITLYIYAASATDADCFSENSFFINIYSIDADDIADVESCDSYVLPALNVGDYYTLPGGPDVAGQVMLNTGDVITTNTTLYVYAELGGRLNCNDEHEFTITIYQTPVVNDTQQDLSVCFEYVLPQLTVGNYFTGSMGTGTQLNAGDVINATATVYIYAATGSDTHTCFDQHSYVVTVNSVYLPDFEDTVYSCQTYTLPALAVGSYYTQPGGQGTPIAPGTVLTTTQTVYVYAETGTVPNCTAEDQFDLIIVQPPVPAAQPTPLFTCAIDDAGHGIFNLQTVIDQVFGNQPNVTVGIYETIQDAQFDENPITAAEIAAYENINPNTQTLYIALTSTLAEGCQTIVEVQLNVNPRPQAVTPAEAYAICDNGTNDADGIGVFDLTIYEDEVLGTMNPAQFTVTYFETAQAAEAGTPVIATPVNYNSDSTTVYIRVTNNATGCYDVVELELIVNPLPVVTQPLPYSLCDVNNPGDAREEFDLTSRIDEITSGEFGLTVTFHDTYAQAVAGTPSITTPDAYTNVEPGVETVFVRVADNETGCYRIVLLDIRVEPLPILVLPTELETTECDTDGDGYATFDLTSLVEDMVNNGADISVAFYETEWDAQNGFNAIENPASYVNAVPFEQEIYVVAVNDNTLCQSTVYAITLFVNPAPQAPDLEDIVLCDDEDNNGQDGRRFVDLTIYEGFIYEETAAAAGTLTIEYFATQQAANNGMPRIVNPANYNGTHEQTIWVRVEMTDTECYSLSSFQLIFNAPWQLTTPTPLTVCNEELPNDNTTIFDLTTKDAEILGPMGVGIGNVVTYHQTQQEAFDGENPITPATAYENETNPEVLFVRVVTPEGCESFTTLSIRVLPLPTPNFTPEALELCDENATGDGLEEFDLTEAEDDIADNDFTVHFAYYPTQADAIAEPPTNEITDPENYVSGTGSVWVRVMANTTNTNDPVCYQLVELPLIVHPLPAQGAVAPYAICEQNTDGFAQFDFNTHLDEILGPDVDPADYGDYTVRFSYNGTPVPYIYTNVVAGNQTIDVYVEYEPTGCNTTVQLQLLVEEQAIAGDVTTPDFDVCDTDGDNDGQFIIDLTQADADIIGS